MSTSYEAAANAVRADFNTRWTAAEPTVPILWDNVTADPPDGQDYVRFVIEWLPETKLDIATQGTLRRKYSASSAC